MKLFGEESGIVSFFLRSGGQPIIIYREDCDAGWDRETGKYITSRNIVIETCALPRPLTERRTIQDDGADRAAGRIRLQTSERLYTTDERDNASADVVYFRSSFWKVMRTDDLCSYHESELELLPDDVCKNLGLPNDDLG